MPTEFTKGDLFETQGIRAYAQGCDCAGAMNEGISVAFQKRFPAMFAEYKQRCDDKSFTVGDVFTWTNDGVTVYTLGLSTLADGKPKLAALIKSTETMVELAQAAGVTSIAMPRLGTGKTGLEWLRVKRILTELGAQTSIRLVVFEQFVRAKN